jgi:hypothetical protein
MASGGPKHVGVTQNVWISRFLCEIVILVHGHEQNKAHSIYFLSEAYFQIWACNKNNPTGPVRKYAYIACLIIIT